MLISSVIYVYYEFVHEVHIRIGKMKNKNILKTTQTTLQTHQCAMSHSLNVVSAKSILDENNPDRTKISNE